MLQSLPKHHIHLAKNTFISSIEQHSKYLAGKKATVKLASKILTLKAVS